MTRAPSRPKPELGARRFTSRWLPAFLLAWAALHTDARASDAAVAAHFRKNIQPILSQYCYDCHGDGEKKGNIAFDELKTDQDLVGKPDLWMHVLENLRPGLMPPAKKPRPTPEEQKRLEDWIKYEAFGIDPQNPDPGRVTVRRLNRVEYHNTIHDLMGIDFHADQEFPADDTGYGFDNIGDVLTVSPMLLEKYLDAAKTIVAEAVPVVAMVMPERSIPGSRFRQGGGKGNTNALALSFYEPGRGSNNFTVEHAGTYKLTLNLSVKGTFDYDPAKCKVVVKLDDTEILQKEFGWRANETFKFDFDEKWQPGEHRVTLELQPVAPVGEQINALDLRLVSVNIRGPFEEKYWERPKNYDRFFTGENPASPARRHELARAQLAKFACKAFRRPVDDQTAVRLAGLAEKVYSQPGKTFEAGVAHAMMAVLASPRFLFRLEQNEKDASPAAAFANVDEYSLASRLSYFLWSTMPDQELIDLAARGELRKNLPSQVKRMLADSHSEQLVQNFTGQWLQIRDVAGASINAQVVFARDSGKEKQIREQREAFLARQRNAVTNLANTTNLMASGTNSLSGTNRLARGNNQRRFRGGFFQPPFQLDAPLRNALRLETEMFFSGVVHEDRSVLELIDSDYTYLNSTLAKLYGMTNENVTGLEMRRVSLPVDSPRGGVLTDGSVLVVTSNPDRTSPVKRGLFILSNFLGTPAPPPPPNIPSLEVSEKSITDHEPTLREALAMHRDKPLCASCHARMDPIGLAFENFNALGVWRDKERNQTIETAGKLITGESFNNVRELKKTLVAMHRMDFYRCLTGKLLTYALGRGLEYYDTETVDKIVARLDQDNGHFSALLSGIIESAPFQKQRVLARLSTSESSNAVGKRDLGTSR